MNNKPFDPKSGMIGFLLCMCGFLLLANAPGEWAGLNEPTQPAFLKDGSNAWTVPAGTTWNLSDTDVIFKSVTCNDIVAAVTMQGRIHKVFPALTSDEQAAILASEQHNVSIFSIVNPTGSVSLSHVESDAQRYWEVASAAETEASTDYLRVAMNDQVRDIKAVIIE